MSFFKNIVLLYALFHIAASSISTDLSTGLTMSWSQIPHKVRSDILVDENGHTIAILRSNDSSETIPTSYNVLVTTHPYQGSLEATFCNVDPLTSDKTEKLVAKKIVSLRKDRVLVVWNENLKEGDPRLKYVVVNMDNCESSEPILYTSGNQKVVAFKNHFEILLFKDKTCSGHDYCKVNVDLDGKPKDQNPVPLEEANLKDGEFLTINRVYPINYNSNEGLVFTAKKDKTVHTNAAPEVYSPISGWSTLEDVAHIQNRYSNSSGYATICWFTQLGAGIHCKWLDNTHSDTMSLDMERGLDILPTIHNTADGNILLIKSGEREGKKLFIDKVQTDGKCSRIMEIAIPAKPDKIRFSISNNNQYCVSLITKEDKSDAKTDEALEHSFTTKCEQMPEKIEEDSPTKCGQNYDSF